MWVETIPPKRGDRATTLGPCPRVVSSPSTTLGEQCKVVALGERRKEAAQVSWRSARTEVVGAGAG